MVERRSDENIAAQLETLNIVLGVWNDLESVENREEDFTVYLNLLVAMMKGAADAQATS